MRTQGSTLDLILAAAEEEFLERGYEAAALRSIAGRAGVTTGALYGYFRNKQELFGALVDTEYHHMLDLYDQILLDFQKMPAREQMEQMDTYTARGMEQMSEYIYSHWNAFKLLLCRSEGTQYTHLVEEMAWRDTQATDRFSQTSQEAGVALAAVNPTLARMLTYSMFSNFFEMVRRDLPKEETRQYITQLLQFYTAGWEKLWSL